MEIEKLKDMLRNAAWGPVGIQMCQEAADALEQLQAENDKLKQLVSSYCDMCWAEEGVLWCHSGNCKCNYCLEKAKTAAKLALLRKRLTVSPPTKTPASPLRKSSKCGGFRWRMGCRTKGIGCWRRIEARAEKPGWKLPHITKKRKSTRGTGKSMWCWKVGTQKTTG